jgi:hypothetical protein
MGRLVCVEVRDIFEGVFGAAGLGALRMPTGRARINPQPKMTLAR